ncbi:MAG: LapA family protein [Glaciimonas sp.]|nr:LapA family protein [Glaciimonas sp.]
MVTRYAGIFCLVFFGFALKNTQEVTLDFFLNYEIRGPLVLILLGFFASGAVLGVLAMTPSLFRHRRSATKNKKALTSLQKEQEAQRVARDEAPQVDSIRNI